jgi:hypothetical protein
MAKLTKLKQIADPANGQRGGKDRKTCKMDHKESRK